VQRSFAIGRQALVLGRVHSGLVAQGIGIWLGVQAFIIGGECSVCGQMAICASCGAWEHEPHRSWCEHD